jgi:hypothetical protein
MDALRRGALMKFGRIAAGVAGVGLTAGRAAPTQAQSGLFADQGLAQDVARNYVGPINPIDPAWRAEKHLMDARYKAAEPLRQQMEAIQGYGKHATLSRARGYGEQQHDLAAMRSVAPWWKDHIAHERAKKMVSAIETIQEQINKLLQSPLDALEDGVQAAIKGFMEEIQKP